MKFSRDSQKMIKFLDKLDLQEYPDLHPTLTRFFKKMINKNEQLTTQLTFMNFSNTEYCSPTSTRIECNTINLLKKLHSQNSHEPTLLSSLTPEEESEFNHFIGTSNTYGESEQWLKVHGNKILINLSSLIQTNQIPDMISEMNIYNDMKAVYNPFCSLDVQMEIEKKPYSLRSYYTDHNKSSIYTQVYRYRERRLLAQCQIRKMNKFILTMMDFSPQMAGIEITIFLTGKKKTLPIHYDVLGAKEVNTGSTSLHGNRSRIRTWRKEELFKVIFHEAMHALHLDAGLAGASEKTIFKHFNISHSQKISLREAYAEAWATILNCIFCVHYYSEDLAQFKKLLQYEQWFSCFQIAKILYFYGYRKFSDFFSQTGEFDTDPTWLQTTSVFSYHIVKGALLNSVNDFITFCHKHNKDMVPFHSTTTNRNRFIKLIIKSCSKKEFQSQVDYCLDYINVHHDRRYFMYRTLRMSCVEFEQS